jgi:non-specific serine/threonine protein kinase
MADIQYSGLIGMRLNRRYQVTAELGSGGMGTVYQARDTLIERDVAVKVISDSSITREGGTRLLQEAQAAGKLNHPNIVTIYDVVEEDGGAYIVMELVQGETLHALQPDSLDQIIDLILQICSALAHAHENGIIHRDLKPENVIMTRDGTVKLMDFGLARPVTSRLSDEGGLEGTVNYISPEQAMGQAVDSRADLYALGVILYELVTGQLPFQGEEPLGVITQHIHSEADPPRTLNPELPIEVEKAILKLLSKQPENRFRSAEELAATLNAIRGEGRKPADSFPHNLPVEVTSFIGREEEIRDVKGHLSDSHLVTLTGPGGSGKTRLALQAAGQLIHVYPNGVWWIDLVSLEDPSLVPQTVARVMNVSETGNETVLSALMVHLQDKLSLLVLDNCEHLIEACAEFADSLLHTCPGVRILATSQEGLGIDGESVFQVPTLSVPSKQTELEIKDLGKFEAIQLFTKRAEAARPEFRLTDENSSGVVHICCQLDGIPLAIELAAARVKMLTVSQIVDRLDDRFHLLTSGRRTALPHHQTLRAMIDWSYGLLDEAERTLFHRLATFVGGWTLEAAEKVCSDGRLDASDVLDLLTQLEEKSIVSVDRRRGLDLRYRFLETIRQYAQEKLFETGETDKLKDHHLEYFLELAENANLNLEGPDQAIWLDRLEADHDNLRAALEWSLSRDDGTGLSLRLAVPLGEFWKVRGFIKEGRDRLKIVLNSPGANVITNERGYLLEEAATLAYLQSDYSACRSLWQESLSIFQRIGPEGRRGEAIVLTGLANTAMEVGDYEIAPRLFKQALAILREVGDQEGAANAIRNLGWVAIRTGDYAKAQERLEEALNIYRQIDNKERIASCLSGLGEVAVRVGDYERAKLILEESLQLRRELKHKWGISASLGTLGWVALRQGDFKQVKSYLGESLTVRQDLGDKGGIAWCLEKLAEATILEGSPEKGASLYGAAAALRRSIDSVIDPADQREYERLISSIHEQIGEEEFQTAWDIGSSMQLDALIKLAVEV